MNFLPGRIEADGIRLDDGTLWTVQPPARLTPGHAVTIGIRPEDLRPAIDGEAGRFEARVSVVEPLGPESLVTIAFAGQELVAKLDGERPPAVDERLALAADPSRLHVFDRDSGKALA
jgi:multiple sugar transport system ATP-binding protein